MEIVKHLFYMAVGAPLALGFLFAMTNLSGQSAWNEISTERMLGNIKVLSSDEYEGRAPASKGEELSTHFIAARLKELGLKPGNPDGTYFQNVPMVGIAADPSAQLVFADTAHGKQLTLKYADDFVAWTKRVKPAVGIDADLVFVGYGDRRIYEVPVEREDCARTRAIAVQVKVGEQTLVGPDDKTNVRHQQHDQDLEETLGVSRGNAAANNQRKQVRAADPEYRYPSLKMCPTSTAVSIRKGFPQFGHASPAVTDRKSAYAVG